MKKLLSLLLCMVLLFSSLSIPGSAEETTTGTTASQSDVEIEGTNSFGGLLSQTLNAEMERQLENNGFNVFSIEYTDGDATVELEALQECTLVVGIYSEDGKELISYQHIDVIKDDRFVTVCFDTSVVPTYFIISAYLVNKGDLKPLCTAYTSTMYTQEMQELLTKETTDFEEDKVLSLDDSIDNNFAVYNDTVEIVEESAEMSVMADEENGVYTITNPTAEVSALQVGDIFSYNYDSGDVLIVKIASISVDENGTITYTEGELELEDVFDYVKIDTTCATEDAEIDNSDIGEDIVYDGIVQDSTTTFIEVDKTKGSSFSYSLFDKKLSNEEGSAIETNVTISGSLKCSVTQGIKVYITLTSALVEFRVDYSVALSVSVSGKVTGNIQLGEIHFSPVAGLYIKFRPSIVVEVSGEISLEGTVSGVIGFSVGTEKGLQNLTSTPKLQIELKAEVKVFIGFSLRPSITIISKKNADLSLTATVGGEASVSRAASVSTDTERHTCKNCLSGVINGKCTISVEAKLLSSKKLTFEFSAVDLTVKVADFYYSFDYGEFDFTKCPHKEYLVNVKVKDENGKILNSANVSIGGSTVKTNSYGNAGVFLPDGKYTLTVSKNGYSSVSRSITVSGSALNFEAKLGFVTTSKTYLVKNSAPAIPMNAGTIVDKSYLRIQIGSNTVNGSKVTIKLSNPYTNGASIQGNLIYAYKKGVYPAKVTYGSSSTTVYIVVKNFSDSKWYLYDRNFAAENYNASSYYDIEIPSGWKSQYAENIYSITLGDFTHVGIYPSDSGITSGIIPFYDTYWIGSGYNRVGIFTLNDSVVKQFSDYTISMESQIYNHLPDASWAGVGLFGRAPTQDGLITNITGGGSDRFTLFAVNNAYKGDGSAGTFSGDIWYMTIGDGCYAQKRAVIGKATNVNKSICNSHKAVSVPMSLKYEGSYAYYTVGGTTVSQNLYGVQDDDPMQKGAVGVFARGISDGARYYDIECSIQRFSVALNNKATECPSYMMNYSSYSGYGVSTLAEDTNNNEYTDLIPNFVYNYYVVESDEGDHLLEEENVKFIGQATSDSEGNLVLPEYTVEDETAEHKVLLREYTRVEGEIGYLISSDETAIITGCSSQLAVSIPETVGGYTPTAITNTAFENCTSLTDVTLCNSITEIADGAFIYQFEITLHGKCTEDNTYFKTYAESQGIEFSETHNYSELKVTALPNEQESGSLSYTCADCGYEGELPLPQIAFGKTSLDIVDGVLKIKFEISESVFAGNGYSQVDLSVNESEVTVEADEGYVVAYKDVGYDEYSVLQSLNVTATVEDETVTAETSGSVMNIVDLNTDNALNVLDLIRMKRTLLDSGDIDIDGDNLSNAIDMTLLTKLILFQKK